MAGKAAYLKKLTERMRFRSIQVGEKLNGPTPPSVFIGRSGYPKVHIGPMITPDSANAALMDAPETWIPQNQQTKDIVQFRLQLVRGRQPVGIHDLDHRLVRQVQEISMADRPIETEAEFRSVPRGFSFNEEHQPFGPSAVLKRFDVGNMRWEPHLEKSYYDTDWKARDAMIGLYRQGVPFSSIQKALSTGTMGLGRNRKLVPTRWSITALDDALGKHLLEEVRYNEIQDGYEVYEFDALHNHFAILLTPTPWQYEWMEAFIHVMENEEAVFSDHERFHGKKEYSSVGGCFYSVRFAVAEKLQEQKKQAGAIVFREAYPGYVPLGVWLCREEARQALRQTPARFDSLPAALHQVASRLRLPLSHFMQTSTLLKDIRRNRQTMLRQFF